jgi:hypothetical protein
MFGAHERSCDIVWRFQFLELFLELLVVLVFFKKENSGNVDLYLIYYILCIYICPIPFCNPVI